ncbi:MAG: hypothetical protein E6G73_08620 [Alphaproteobacteria bacterium]|nr:MAG: hypothetical protein E6G73_08620 [Alphaproteobacteria bacterium]
MTATMAMSAEKRAGICRSLARNVGCSVNGSIKALARIIKLARVMRIHLRLIQARKSPSSNEDSAWQWHSRNHMTKIVEKQGSLFRLSDAAYRRLLELVIAEQEYDLWELGRCIGCIHASMGSFQRDDAEFELARQDINASAIVQPNASNRRERPAAGRSGGSSIECK